MSDLLKVGDTVIWRGSYGRDLPKKAKVESIDYCPNGGKYGEPVDSIPWNCINDVTVDLDIGHWAYGHQIKKHED